MDLENKSVLILGGSGLVGHAVARRLLDFQPARVTLVALYEPQVRATAEVLRPLAGDTEIVTEWGDIFLPVEAAKVGRGTMLEDGDLRDRVVEDTLADLDQGVLDRSFLYQLFTRYRPHAVVDCINTATAFAYQNVFDSARHLRNGASAGSLTVRQVDEHVLSIPLPLLIRHAQIMVEALQVGGTQAYVKIGTSGTGGMGMNVPYTHSEERPSRQLLAKSAVAGAHSLLLFLVGRTPGAPAVSEIKPTAAIAWREIAYGPVRRRGQPIQLYDCPTPLAVSGAFGRGASGWKPTGKVMQSVFADVGENGLFAREEFETVTALGQMEFITPEEVAEYVILELQGRPTGRDVVSALDAATSGPTYRAGVLRAHAVQRLRELEAVHGVPSVGFEMLGPPRLTKMLYEAYLLSRVCDSVERLAGSAADHLSAQLVQLVTDDVALRSIIISVGLPILLADGKLYRADEVIVPPVDGDVERATSRGWVDLRPASCETWVQRAQQMTEQAKRGAGGSGSDGEWEAIEPTGPISPAQFATWVFRYEDRGERIKR